MLLVYLIVHRGELAALAQIENQIELLATPWRLALFGLGIALVTQAGRWMHKRAPRLLAGPFALSIFTAPSAL